MERNHHIVTNDTICWICVYADSRNAGSSLSIAYHLDVCRQLRQTTLRTKLIYFRQFNNVVDAFAHKLLLEHLSRTSLDELICRMNPEREDLRRLILPKQDK